MLYVNPPIIVIRPGACGRLVTLLPVPGGEPCQQKRDSQLLPWPSPPGRGDEVPVHTWSQTEYLPQTGRFLCVKKTRWPSGKTIDSADMSLYVSLSCWSFMQISLWLNISQMFVCILHEESSRYIGNYILVKLLR